MSNYRGSRAKTVPFYWVIPAAPESKGTSDTVWLWVTCSSRTQGCLMGVQPPSRPVAGESEAPLRVPCLPSTVRNAGPCLYLFLLAHPQTPASSQNHPPLPQPQPPSFPFPPKPTPYTRLPDTTIPRQYFALSRQFPASYAALPHNQTLWPRSAENSSSSVTVPVVKPAC